ncbi:hypothetical protein Patl1_01887 [Pistacia atlantica]|uniref:Uncharacterized protein n=1 Tax=Pistacia atlantica TaxID=434234 RepID=A0ACC1C6M2_9ROSI|nr:hypothetical protein Patl1_01887 [Pistacia atlantica]
MHFSRRGENVPCLIENDPCLILYFEYPIRNQQYSLELSSLNEDSQKSYPNQKESPNQQVLFGFGFHPTTKEYKVVKVVYDLIPKGFSRYNGIFVPSQQETLVNGRLHWATCPERYRPHSFLVSFDLTDEQFGVVPKPDCGGLDSSDITPLVFEVAFLQ